MERGATAASSGKCYHVENTLWFLQCAKSILISQRVSVFTQNIFFKYLKVFLKNNAMIGKDQSVSTWIYKTKHKIIKTNVLMTRQPMPSTKKIKTYKPIIVILTSLFILAVCAFHVCWCIPMTFLQSMMHPCNCGYNHMFKGGSIENSITHHMK